MGRSAVALVIGTVLALPAVSGAAGWTTVPGAPSAASGTAEEPVSVAVDGQDNLWLAFSDASGGVGTRLHVYERSPGGSFVSVLDKAQPDVGPPLIAAADGTVAVAYGTFSSNVFALNLAIRPPGGTFGAPVQGASNASSFLSRLTVLPDGTALLAWRDGTSPNIHLHVASVKAGGSVVDETPTGIGTDPGVPEFASNASGEAVVAWDDTAPNGDARVAFSERPPGGSFGATQEIASRKLVAPETAQANILKSVALDDAGDLAATAGVSVVSSGSTTNTLRVHVRPAGQASFQHATLDTGTTTTGPEFVPAAAIALAPDRSASVIWIGVNRGLFASGASEAGGFVFGPGAPFTGLVSGSCLGSPSGSILLAPLAGGGGVAGLFSDPGFLPFCFGSPLTPIAPAITGTTVPPAIEPAGASASPLVADAHGDAFAAVGFSPEQAAVAVIAYDASPPTIGAITRPKTIAAGKPASFSVQAADAISAVTVTWDFGDGGAGGGASATHTWARPGSYLVTAVATDGGGNTATTSLHVTVLDRTPPVLSHVSLSHKKFKTRHGTKVRFALSERATVKFTVTHKVAGRRSGKRCISTRSHRRIAKDARCKVTRTVTTSSHRSLDAGTHAITFHHKLAPGTYQLVLTPTDPAGNKSAPKVLKFKIV